MVCGHASMVDFEQVILSNISLSYLFNFPIKEPAELKFLAKLLITFHFKSAWMRTPVSLDILPFYTFSTHVLPQTPIVTGYSHCPVTPLRRCTDHFRRRYKCQQ